MKMYSDTRKMHITLRYMSISLFFFLDQLQRRPLEHLFIPQHAKNLTIKLFIVRAYKKENILGTTHETAETPL